MPIDETRSVTGPSVVSPGRPAMIGALIASMLTLLAFFAMPVISFGPFRLTGSEIAGAPDALGGEAAALALLWVIPIASIAAVVAAVSHLVAASAAARGRGTLVAALAGIALLVYVIALALVLREAGEVGASEQAFSVIGGGFWVGVLGATAAVACGLSASRAASGAR